MAMASIRAPNGKAIIRAEGAWLPALSALENNIGMYLRVERGGGIGALLSPLITSPLD